MKTQKKGYVLVLTLMIISVLVIIVTSMFFNETSHTAFSRTMIDKEKAKMLALGGVQLALSQLTIKPPEKKDKKGTEKPGDKKNEQKQESNEKLLLKRIFPTLNNWQPIKFTQENDGIDGQIKFCICCEEGKININEIYDFANHRFLIEGSVVPGQESSVGKAFQEFTKSMQQFSNDRNSFSQLQEFLKKRKYPLNDITELLEISGFSYFKEHVFYEPPSGNEKSRPIFLTDIFTTWTESSKLQPLLLSDSICALLGLKRADMKDSEQREKQIGMLLKNFKPDIQWLSDWDRILKPFYKKDFKALPRGIENMLDNQFSPKVFSVISYGSTKEITQRIFAIIEIESNGAIAKLKKLYWI